MDKIRVLNIITRLEHGGAPLALLETIRRLSSGPFQIDLATGQTDDPALDLTAGILNSGFPLIQIPALQRNIHPYRDAKAFWHIARLIQKGHYQLVHTHTSKAGFLGRIAARICGVPAVVHSPHGTVLEGYFSPLVSHLFAFLEHLAAPMSDRIICLTAREIDQYRRAQIGSRDQYTYIYNGIDIAGFSHSSGNRDAIREELGIPRAGPTCITVGRLVPVKGQVDLLKAFQQALKQRPDLHLLILGEGVLRTSLEDLASELNIANRVHFLGWRDDVGAVLETADLFVLPSHNEGLGLVLVEAMAKRLPIIATDVGGVPEVVIDGQTGVLVPAHSPHELARAIVDLASDPTRSRQMGEAGYRRAQAVFSIEATTRKTEALYRTLTGVSP